jgi:predicted nicotinamide N-methyase
VTEREIGAGRAFVLANTSPIAPPHVPEIVLHLADEAHDLWHLTEDELQEKGLPPPFWAFAWAGGQGLARHMLDEPATVRGKTVLDVASGSGLVGIAAAMSGAARVLCADIDPFCEQAVALNARLNGVDVDFIGADMIGTDCGWEVVLAGDVFYDSALAARLLPWFDDLVTRGATVLIGDPGRSYLPKSRIVQQAEYHVAVTRALEDAEVKRTRVWRYT